MQGAGSSSVRGFWSRAARPVVALSAAGGFVLALPFMAVPASAAPAPAVPLANPAHHHSAASRTTSTAAPKAELAVPATSPAHTFHPVASAPDAPQDPGKLGSGQCFSTNPNHNCTLRAAVMEADYEGAYIAIVLSAGTYHLTIPPANTSDASTGNLDVTDPQTVTFTGAGATHTFIDASTMGDRVFQVEGNAVARMTGFTIQHGNAANTGNNTDAGKGGGIDVSATSAALVLQRVRLTLNTAAADGGGLWAGGALWATSSQVDHNTASVHGGGVYLQGTARLVNDSVTDNSAASQGGGVAIYGGGVAFQGGSVSRNHLLFADHQTARGGGIYIDEATTIVGTSINDNTIGPSGTATSGTGQGGGIFNYFGLNQADRLTIRGNTVSGLNNTLSYCAQDGGGGIFDYIGMAMTNSVVSGNQAPTGGGGGIFNCGDVERLTRITVSTNSAGRDGGGIWADYPAVISQSSITGNTSGGNGGGFWSDDGQQIDQTLIAGNHAVQGGGFWNMWKVLFTNDTFTGNVASGTGNAGGAFYESAADSDVSAQFTNVTIAGNKSDDGGGIANVGGAVTVHNTIISGNRANSSSTDTNCDVTQPLTDAGNNLDSGHTCGLTGPGDKQNTNPKLGALANNGGPTRTMALLSGSPAINAGSSPAPSVDQRGFKRDSRPDIGAFEVQ